MSAKPMINLPDPPYLLGPWVRLDPATGQPVPSEKLLYDLAGSARLGLSAARNEYVSFQVILPADWLGPKLRIELGGLNPAAAIGPGEIDFFVQWAFQHEGAWYPDALIPPDRIEQALRLGMVSRIGRPKIVALWVDVFVPREAKPGMHSATLTVRSGPRQQADLGLDLNVWPFAIDDQCHMHADMNSYSAGYVRYWPEFSSRPDMLADPRARRINLAYFRMAHEHRSMLQTLNYQHSGAMATGFAPELTGQGDQIRVKSWALFDKIWGPLYDGSAFRGTRRGAIPVPHSYTPFNFQWPASFIHFGQPGYGEMWRRIGREFGDHAAKLGWTKTKFAIFFNHKKRYRFFPFDGDETRFLADGKIFQTYYDLAVRDMVARKDMQYVYRTDSSWAIGTHSVDEMSDMFGLWVASGLIGGWYKSGIENLLAKGHEVFFYGGGTGFNDTLREWTNWPILTWMRGGHGYGPWLCTGGGPTPLTGGPQERGRTAYFYVGNELGIDGPIANIRTKIMRDMLQTIEYLWLMAERNNGDRRGSWDLVNRVMGTNASTWWNKAPGFATEKPPHLWHNKDFSIAPRMMPPDFDIRDNGKLRVAAGEALAGPGR